ncbi:transcriptional regulator, MarR family [Rhodomicrobium vannielii ATCC 17100]|jgi:DNA-binding MarR family transcriptional regulator|uniref:Transcriptional regulator, MarR family n=1 Tax=Rhodomicrobium vannielii (strain ATCC 17100 / DSM 162 / LMG 4299 / NCIMB 10020 / ATH 3.1.1) TaxID=648757 RepID=E3I2U1_RHOVT|nr:MarR family transcriptional regulator [Rhodomicrobium vannielii]ADP72536.1 transcriptional regulator, MarR family [Rhodomicrobium vannielii ATCC 17100]
MSNHLATQHSVPYDITLLVRDTCLCLHAQRAARALARRFDAELKDTGITSGQFSLLMALNRPAPPRLGSVAALLAMDRTTLTANLKPLERSGMIEVFPDNRDRRTRLLRITPMGLEVLARAVPVWQRTHAAIDAELGTQRADRLRMDLDALCARDVSEGGTAGYK